jgi:hypothetical protein
MTLIKNSFPGRRDGNYSTIFGDDDIGSLISAVHATSIAMGNDLEHIVIEFANIIDETLIDAFFDKTLKPGIYVIPKRMFSLDKRLKFDQKPDVLVVNVVQNTCKVIEIKLGDNFDTKKSQGEVQNLKAYADKLDKATTYRVSIGVCMWYAKDRSAVVKGFKNAITEREALTGLEFCNMTNMDYEMVNARISMHKQLNREFLFEKVTSIIKKYEANV